MTLIRLDAARDPVTGQVYVPPRTFVADGSLREPEALTVPARGVLHSATVFAGQAYGIVDLDCGARIQALLEPGTDRIGERVGAHAEDGEGTPRFSYE